MTNILRGSGITINHREIDEHTLGITLFAIEGEHYNVTAVRAFREWESTIPLQYDTIVTNVINNQKVGCADVRLWTDLGFGIDRNPYTMSKDISALSRDARMPFLVLTSVQEVAAEMAMTNGCNDMTTQSAMAWAGDVHMAHGKHDGRVVDNPGDAIVCAAVAEYPSIMQYLKKDPAEFVQFAAIKTDPHALWSIARPSLHVQLAAVKQAGNTIDYVKDYHPIIQFAALTSGCDSNKFNVDVMGDYDYLFDDAVLEAVRPGLSLVCHLLDGESVQHKHAGYAAFHDAPTLEKTAKDPISKVDCSTLSDVPGP